ncbi:hypothetical protein FNH22_27755 [Fulvivirga sp. M361]|uniref:hypothetical protein n=1 Tax=Fulvivirga sp. M361 TaxID=2594266 RepID=UPI001179CD05|nr:hypothetical protein [Fulvivirga sp. M361]TRX49031.1 hypothetical protein FNH22_27755 [Fulvivirga sp. M361]
MMKNLLFIALTSSIILLGCVEDAFEDGGISNSPQAPSDLQYSPVVQAREFGVLISAPPTYNSFGAIPSFEIVAVHDEDGNPLSDTTIDDFFSILNGTPDTIMVAPEDGFINEDGDTIRTFPIVNVSDIGRIQIEGENTLVEGSYFFDIKMTTVFDDQSFSATFERVFELYLGPQLASGLVYIPGGQNLLTSGGTTSTTEPIVIGANPDFRFELGDNTDKFTIDATTGVITLNSGYTPTEEPEIVSPTVNVVSNISEEIVSFNSITIYISNSPFDVPKLVVSVFYPTFEFENTEFGYRIHTVEEGDPGIFWNRLAAPGIADDDRPAENANQKRLEINLVKPSGGNQVPHESWAIMNAQDLSAYEFGYDIEAEFFSENRFVEYLSTDGSSPSFLAVYVSTDYRGDFNNATWVEVTDQLESNIISDGEFIEGNEFEGYPYPGDQNLRDFTDTPWGKDPSKNADDKWVRSTFDMVDYIGMSNVTVAFRVYTTFEGAISSSFPYDRSGRYLLSDFNITAYEQ